MNQPARIAHARWAMLAASLLLLASCDREPQEIALAVSVVQWAQPDMPAEGVKVILEEQRLTNGVVNAFYTAVDEQLTDASGMVELNTERTNVLAMRVRAEKEGCFDEILDVSPSSLVTDGTPNPFSLAIMPLCLVQADIDNTNSPCPSTDMIYKWIPREVGRRGVGRQMDLRHGLAIVVAGKLGRKHLLHHGGDLAVASKGLVMH